MFNYTQSFASYTWAMGMERKFLKVWAERLKSPAGEVFGPFLVKSLLEILLYNKIQDHVPGAGVFNRCLSQINSICI